MTASTTVVVLLIFLVFMLAFTNYYFDLRLLERIGTWWRKRHGRNIPRPPH